MNLLYDHQIFAGQSVGGISRYHCELLREFTAIPGLSWRVSAWISNNEYLKGLQPLCPFFPRHPFQGRGRILEQLNRPWTRFWLHSPKTDLFHPTFYDPYFLKDWAKRPLVITIHDMIHDLYPELPMHRWETAAKKRLAERADAIIVPSQKTADDLIRLNGTPSAKIHIIAHGAPRQSYRNATPSEQEFLYVGGRNYYKNFDVVLRALAKEHHFRLCCVGSAFSQSEKDRITAMGLRERIRQTQVNSDDELQKLYAGAAGFIYSSEYEGFGIPILEAFAANCPVLLADTPVFREVASDAALYFSPHNECELASRMRETGSAAAELRERGFARVQQFSWRATAQATYRLYQAAIG